MSNINSNLEIDYIRTKIKRRDIKSVLSALTTNTGSGGSGNLTGSGTTNEIAYFTGATSLGSLTTATYPSLTELSYVKGVTSSIQTQFTGKLNTGLAWLLASGGTLTASNTIAQAGNLISYQLDNIKQVVTRQIKLENTTAATSTVADQIQFSGALTFKGAAWKSNATASSQDAETYLFQRPSTGTSVITGQLLIEHFINGSFTSSVSFLSTGGINVLNSAGIGFGITSGSGFGMGRASGSIIHSGGMLFTSTAGSVVSFQYSSNVTSTSGTFDYFNISSSVSAFAPTSGTAIFNFWRANPIINQTGGANGISRGFYWNPTNTAVGAAQVAFKHDSGYVEWTSILSPSQITSNQNDYNPTGFNTGGSPYGASILRLSTDASRDLTGLSGGTSGRLLIIANVGSFDLVIKDESASSTAGNRFALNADITLQADESLMFFYDGTSSRWRALTNA
jgi:hypothetical protein